MKYCRAAGEQLEILMQTLFNIFGGQSRRVSVGKVRLVPVLIILLLLPSLLYASRRTYESNQPMGELVAAMIEEMGDADFQFQIEKVFSPDSDGKLGFAFRMQPSNTLCEITLIEDEANADRSIVQVFAQDQEDARRLHAFFVERMRMKEKGAYEIPDGNNNWPVQGVR
ncbi:MAG: hypothetical protein KDK30_14010 [Leptospiraceae bacterium]|nr:hypothetical protein [Leptospiraceae bacterium]